eukprot:SRR837773.3589.p1 GENE.SRR837773.3589~~SRR837773.3589.p1  ORF type:complete len:203 (+),score=49.57 SRR837773.3589:88-609(+)
MRHIRREAAKEEGSACRVGDNGEQYVPSFHVRAVLEDLGHAPLIKESAVLRGVLETTTSTAMEAREKGEWEGPPAEVDGWGLARLCRQYREELRQQTIKFRGFSERQAEELKVKFLEHDNGKGEISSSKLRDLLGQLFKHLFRSQEARLGSLRSWRRRTRTARGRSTSSSSSA